MPDRDARAFGRSLTIVLSILGLLTAGSVFLFGHLLFKSLSKNVVDDALLHSKLDAERIARSAAEQSAGDPYILKLKQTEIEMPGIAAPNSLHAEMGLDGGRAEKHVVCVKPFAMTIEKGEDGRSSKD